MTSTDVLAAQRGDRAAFGRLVTAHQHLAWGTAFAILRDSALSQDVAQDAFVRAWSNLAALRDPQSFAGWLRQTVRRLAVDAWRARKRQNALTAAAPEVPNPEETFAARAELALLAGALAAVDSRDRELLVAHLYEDLSLRDLAARFSSSEAAAQKRLSRARAHLQKEVESRLTITLKRAGPTAAFVIAVLASLDARAAPPPSALALAKPALTVGLAGIMLCAAASTIWKPATASSPAMNFAPTYTSATAAPRATVAAAPAAPLPALAQNDRCAIGNQTFAAGMSGDSLAADRESVHANPNDLAAQARLAGNAWAHQDRGAWAAHISVVIEQCPAATVFEENPMLFMPTVRDRDDGLVALWQAQTEKHREVPQVWANASSYLTLLDNKRAIEWMSHAVRLQPKNVRWLQKLAHLFAQTEGAANTVPGEPSENAFGFQARAIALMSDSDERFAAKIWLARYALSAGENARAASGATELLAEAPAHAEQDSFGEAVHHGHIVLGRLALQAGNVAEARSRLLAAGDTPGSAGLRSFGPDVALARELLAHGERAVVIDYLRRVDKFWQRRHGCIDTWTAQIAQAHDPDPIFAQSWKCADR